MNRLLLIIDAQNDFIDGVLGTKEAQSIIPNIVTKISLWQGEKIIATQDTHFSDYLNTAEGKFLPVSHCQYKTFGWRIRKEVKE